MHIILNTVSSNKTEIDPNELGCDNKHDTLSVINVFIERFLQYPNEPSKNPMGRIIKQILILVQYRGEAGLSKLHW